MILWRGYFPWITNKSWELYLSIVANKTQIRLHPDLSRCLTLQFAFQQELPHHWTLLSPVTSGRWWNSELFPDISMNFLLQWSTKPSTFSHLQHCLKSSMASPQPRSQNLFEAQDPTGPSADLDAAGFAATGEVARGSIWSIQPNHWMGLSQRGEVEFPLKIGPLDGHFYERTWWHNKPLNSGTIKLRCEVRLWSKHRKKNKVWSTVGPILCVNMCKRPIEWQMMSMRLFLQL